MAWNGQTLQNQLTARRVLAIDVFRGLTILVMIFVNTLSGVRGMPAWLEHMPADADGMTPVDVVFPAFLFIVGMSVPFAIAQRLAKGDSMLRLQWHIVLRALGLLVLGVFMVNAEDGYNEAAMHMSIHLWCLLFYAAALLVWNVYPARYRRAVLPLRLAGMAGLLLLAWVFRGGPDGARSLAPQWWGILGLIGWAYLYSCIAYQLARGRLLALFAALVFCVLYYCLAHAMATPHAPLLQLLMSQGDNAAHTSIAVCGVITSLIFFDERRPAGHAWRFAEAALVVLALLTAGYLLRPYFNISKIHATPTWCLYSASACVLLFAALYALVDLCKLQAWTTFLRPAAANPLLAYLIPFIVYAAMHYLGWPLPDAFNQGAPGLLWALAYAFGVMALVAGLNRAHVKLQL